MTIINFLWDFSIRTDHELGARSPDLLIVNKREKSCQIIDVAIPENGRVRKKEDEKVEKYQNLAKEVWKMYDAMTKVIPVVMGGIRISTNESEKKNLTGSR